ncbi:M3 family metallopeptidase [Tessaracoccus sp. OS52]|uniref:M3 family metallopeptidase n=1 Tax=Tessaracoccus sp. OS52 TaxID=2886691 RepID=UPI001D1053DD|nr:M3 family metallopeptidase [Tessaracoccus sp. OS52]MCC2592709.1 M3 family metallopeptidase [Tessaracoccus sp. OS52]
MTNSLLHPSELEFRLPDYANLTDSDYREALLVGMAEQLTVLDAIATNSNAPTVANTLADWERSEATLRRGLNAFWVAKSADTNPERDAIYEEFAPKLAAHSDKILLDARLYERLTALRDRADSGSETLDEQDSHLLQERLREYVRGGITLSEDDQTRLREINVELARLSAQFQEKVVAGRNAAGVHVTDESELDGLPEDDRATARASAEAAGLDGWLLDIVNTTGQPALDYLTNRSLRERIFRASISRGLEGEHDTRELVIRSVRLRHERARLLGFEHHAAYVADDGCARTTKAVNDLLARVAPGVLELVEREAVELQRLLAEDVPGATLEPWDWQFYAARAAAANAVDQQALRPYLEFERVLQEGVFAAATALYGITFHERPELVGYTPDARVFEVREADGAAVGVVVIDPFTRPTKQGGAWMTSIVDQSHLLGDLPVVTNTCNFPKPAEGSPSLLSWDNVITLFHEFGHDLHGLLSDVKYPSRSGTAVPRDFVEFPSQVNEIWAWEPQLIARFAVHHETGEPIPSEWIDALVAGRRQGLGYSTFEALAAQFLDQVWHQTPAESLPTSAEDVETFEAAALEEAGVNFPLVPPRYRSTYFQHIFASGYSAAYYSYLWSEVMDADTVAWFNEFGGLSREAGERFRRRLLAPGGSVEAMDSYRDFRGADPDVAHLLERLGLE